MFRFPSPSCFFFSFLFCGFASAGRPQILTQYADITAVEFPRSFTRFLSYLDLVNFDLGWLLSASCILEFHFYERLLLTTLGPLVLAGMLACTFVYAR